jgi:hypothetical protein
MSHFEYRDVREGLGLVLREAFEPLRHLLPPWARVALVKFVPEPDDDNSMTTMAHREYHQAVVRVYPKALALPADQLRLTALHEVLHIPTKPFYDQVVGLVEQVVSDESMRRYLVDSVLLPSYEQMVDELAYGIAALMEAPCSGHSSQPS